MESFGASYLDYMEGSGAAGGYPIMLAGAIVAWFTVRSEKTCTRSAYFLYSALLVFVTAFVDLGWRAFYDAMVANYVGALALLSFMTHLVTGFFLGRVAAARSQEAFGGGIWAFLSFVPIGNLWLLFTPANPRPTTPADNWAIGFQIAVGFVALIGMRALETETERQLNALTASVETDPSIMQTIVRWNIHARGLEAALAKMARDAEPPYEIDEITTLSTITVQGGSLLRTMEVARPSTEISLSAEWVRGGNRGLCADLAFLPIYEAGGRVSDTYVASDSQTLARLEASLDTCSAPVSDAPIVEPASDTESSTIAEFLDESAVFTAVQETNPDEFAEFVAILQEIERTAESDADAAAAGLTAGRVLNRRLVIEKLPTVPDAELRRYWQQQLRVLDLMQDYPRDCYAIGWGTTTDQASSDIPLTHPEVFAIRDSAAAEIVRNTGLEAVLYDTAKAQSVYADILTVLGGRYTEPDLEVILGERPPEYGEYSVACEGLRRFIRGILEHPDGIHALRDMVQPEEHGPWEEYAR